VAYRAGREGLPPVPVLRADERQCGDPPGTNAGRGFAIWRTRAIALAQVALAEVRADEVFQDSLAGGVSELD
jgi:hypothetical protein